MDYTPPPENQPAVVITASRLPEKVEDSAASATIVDTALLERLGEPSVTAYLRLLPSTSVATSGPAGSFTQVRIRGAEANHTLLFVDGIRANDPAAGNEPRFELLNADIASRIEQVRGPQSALWGSEAIGGVISVNGSDAVSTGASGTLEAGSFGFRRGAGSASYGSDLLGVALAYGHSEADGIDSFDGHGDRDGFVSNALRGVARWTPVAKLKLTASGFFLDGRSDYDGFDPITFLRDDTLDRTKNRIAAGRIGATYGVAGDAWQASLSGSILGSRNVNLLGDDEINRTKGRRTELDAQVSRGFATGKIDHLLIVAASTENERFTASDVAFGGFTDQSRRRHRDIAMPEQLLHRANVVPVFQQVGGERMAHDVRADTLRQAGAPRRLRQRLLDDRFVQMIARRRPESWISAHPSRWKHKRPPPLGPRVGTPAIQRERQDDSPEPARQIRLMNPAHVRLRAFCYPRQAANCLSSPS